MPSQIDANLQFEQDMMPEVTAVLRRHAMHVVKIGLATRDQDTKEATDLVLTVESGAIGVRCRRIETMSRPYRDWTIRATLPSGGRTEIHKLREGWGDWYLYAWAQENRIKEYMLFDLVKVRDAGLLEEIVQTEPRPNPDGTSFYSIPARTLIQRGCMVVHTIKGHPGEYRTADRALVEGNLQTIIQASQAALQNIRQVSVSH